MNDTDFFNLKKWYSNKNITMWTNHCEDKELGNVLTEKDNKMKFEISEKMTNLFTLRYLQPNIHWIDVYPSISDKTEFEAFFYWCDIEVIKNRIKTMQYKDFLNTLYWDLVKTLKKEQVSYKCELCNCNSKLAIHHKTYENHGDEYNHLEDLIVLCSDCHAKFHDKLAEGK